MGKRALRSLSLSYQRKDWEAGPAILLLVLHWLQNIRLGSGQVAQVRLFLISKKGYAFFTESLCVTQVSPFVFFDHFPQTEIVLSEWKFFGPGETLRDTLIRAKLPICEESRVQFYRPHQSLFGYDTDKYISEGMISYDTAPRCISITLSRFKK